MKFGYFTLMDNPPAYGARRRDPNRFFHEVMEEAGIEEVLLYFNVGLCPHVETMEMMERFARGVMPAFAGT